MDADFMSMKHYFFRLFALAIFLLLAACQSAEITSAAQPYDVDKLPPQLSQGIQFIEANNLRFAYLEEGEGPLVLLLHGYPETARSWQTVQHRLAAAGYRVVAPFMRGYPPTDAASDYTIPSLGRDVVALIDALGAERAVVVGHDWGAAAVYQAQALEPAKLSAMVAMSFPVPGVVMTHPQLLFKTPHFVYYQFPWAEHVVTADDFTHVDELYAKWAPGYALPEAVRADIKTTFQVPGATANALAYYKDLLGFTDIGAVYDSLSYAITTPSLVIAGDADSIKPALYDSTRDAFTGPYQFLALENVGHFPQLEAPERVADAILAFIQAHP